MFPTVCALSCALAGRHSHLSMTVTPPSQISCHNPTDLDPSAPTSHLVLLGPSDDWLWYSEHNKPSARVGVVSIASHWLNRLPKIPLYFRAILEDLCWFVQPVNEELCCTEGLYVFGFIVLLCGWLYWWVQVVLRWEGCVDLCWCMLQSQAMFIQSYWSCWLCCLCGLCYAEKSVFCAGMVYEFGVITCAGFEELLQVGQVTHHLCNLPHATNGIIACKLAED